MNTNPRHRSMRALTALAGVASVGVVIAAPASATSFGATKHTMANHTVASQSATVRVAHLSPDMPGADVYLTSFTGGTSVFLRDATYGQLSTYRQVPPGSYTFAIRKHGAAATSAPLMSVSLNAQAGDAYTAAIVGAGSHHRGLILHDNLTPPAHGHANVRFIQASSRAGTVDVDALHGPVIAQSAAFGSSTGYASIKAGTWPLRALGNHTSTTADVSLQAGSVTSVILLDTQTGGTRLTATVDAAGAAVASAPSGSVDAGGGGTAGTVIDRSPGSADVDVRWGAGAFAVVALFLVAVLARPRKREVHQGPA